MFVIDKGRRRRIRKDTAPSATRNSSATAHSLISEKHATRQVAKVKKGILIGIKTVSLIPAGGKL